MDELRYQVDLLNAINQRLTNDEKMYRFICNTSNNTFLYINFVENEVRTLANWNFFFPDVEIHSIEDLEKLYSQVEDKYVLPFRDLMFPEKIGMNADSGIVRLKDGVTWVECESGVLYDELGNVTDKAICFKDVSKFKYQSDELIYMAYYDILTGLYNKNYFVRLLADFVRKAEEAKSVVEVMFIDIDDFKKINNGLGLGVGDEVIQQFGQFLSGFQDKNVLVSHFDSDTFCIAVYEPDEKTGADRIYHKMHDRVKKPFYLSTGQEIRITVSAGVAEYPRDSMTTLDLINCAEIVMFKAKRKEKDSIQFFNASILNEFLQNATIETKLKGVIFSQNFVMNFQPQYYVKGQKLRGMEALIRWRDSDGKMISPAVFIPIAEKNGTIVPIGTWVLEESIKCFAEWKKKYSGEYILSLNISVIQYMREEFIDSVLGIIKKYDINPKELELEITETVLIENFKEITEKMRILRGYGIRISLDDFGTGYSSLSYLKGLPIDTLKIDKSFIDTSIIDENTRIITESIFHMAKRLGFETVAEGVETHEQYEYMEEIGCDCIQGYLLGRPMPKEDIERLLRTQI